MALAHKTEFAKQSQNRRVVGIAFGLQLVDAFSPRRLNQGQTQLVAHATTLKLVRHDDGVLGPSCAHVQHRVTRHGCKLALDHPGQRQLLARHRADQASQLRFARFAKGGHEAHALGQGRQPLQEAALQFQVERRYCMDHAHADHFGPQLTLHKPKSPHLSHSD